MRSICSFVLLACLVAVSGCQTCQTRCQDCSCESDCVSEGGCQADGPGYACAHSAGCNGRVVRGGDCVLVVRLSPDGRELTVCCPCNGSVASDCGGGRESNNQSEKDDGDSLLVPLSE